MAEFMSVGELMLRLKSPGNERLLQSPTFEATFGGGEANVAVSLANYGLDSGFISVIPANPIGDAAIRELRGFGVETRHIQRGGERMGIYFLETGANQRPSNVVYDRAYSSIAGAGPGAFKWEEIFQGCKWLHITGITPALSESAAKLSQYWITPIAEWHSLEKSLAGAWGIRTVVDKRREVFFWNNVRIHFDQVVDLGVFVELEAVLSDTISEEEGRRQADFLCTQLELPLSGLLKESYVDLKLAREA